MKNKTIKSLAFYIEKFIKLPLNTKIEMANNTNSIAYKYDIKNIISVYDKLIFSNYMIRVGLIVDNYRVSKWELDCLQYVKDFIKIELILNCENTKVKKIIFKHFLYYILNFFFIKSKITNKINLKQNYQNIESLNFQSIYDEKWQIIPKNN